MHTCNLKDYFNKDYKNVHQCPIVLPPYIFLNVCVLKTKDTCFSKLYAVSFLNQIYDTMFIVPEVIFKITPGSSTIKDIFIFNYKKILINFYRTPLGL